MKLTLQRSNNSGLSIHVSRVTLERGRIKYQSQPGDRYEEVALKDEMLIIEDDEQPVRKPLASLLHKPVSLMPKPRAPWGAAGVLMATAGCGLVHAGSVRSPMPAEPDAPLPLWLAIPGGFFALAFFYLATVKLSDAWAARVKTRRQGDKETRRGKDGSILPGLITALAVVAMLLAVFGIYSVGHDEWKHHVTAAELKDGVGSAGLCLLACCITYLTGRNHERERQREDRRRLKLPRHHL